MQKRATINMMCKVICDISTSHVRLEVGSAAANDDKNTRKDGNRRNQHIVVKSTTYITANKVLCVGSFWSKNELEKVIITIQQYILVFSHVSSSLVASSILIPQQGCNLQQNSSVGKGLVVLVLGDTTQSFN